MQERIRRAGVVAAGAALTAAVVLTAAQANARPHGDGSGGDTSGGISSQSAPLRHERRAVGPVEVDKSEADEEHDWHLRYDGYVGADVRYDGYDHCHDDRAARHHDIVV